MTMTAIAAAILWVAVSCAALALFFRRPLSAAWREPVLRAPVLILESDDWGYGPLQQAERLDRLAELLSRFRDAFGRHPVTTIGVVVGGPDTERMREDRWEKYHRLALDDPRLAPVREAMQRGVRRHVFALQLHGMEHFWPACLMRAAKNDAHIRQWLDGAAFPSTEELPAPLQSRWVDATKLPSKPLPAEQIAAAAVEEVRAFTAVFGASPEVVVPATFVWNDTVETAWADAGARVVVTPGVRNEGRAADGGVVAGERVYFTGETGAQGVSYVVRDCYFEPSLGQTHTDTLRSLRARTHLGRPTLIEMHRFNFIGDERAVQRSFDEVRELLRTACAEFPNLRFMSTAELASYYRQQSALIERRTPTRVHFLIRRLAGIPRLRKLGWATGAALPALLAYVVTRPRDFAAPAASV
jgi:pimeloyl-ACP methyl ester carboxylesterase